MSTDFGLIMAGAALASIPIIIVFVAFQKYFTQGIAMGAGQGLILKNFKSLQIILE